MRRDPTFNEFFIDIYLPHARARKRSWTLDERLCRRHIMPYLGERHLAQISPADVESWLETLRAKGLAPSSCNRILALLKSVFAFAIITCHIAFGRSPCRNIRNFKIMKTMQTYLSKGEGRRLISHLRTIDRGEARIIELLLLTGARKSEILHARWENLDCERRILTVPISKSGRPRYIYLSREAVEIFRNIVPAEGSPWIFPGRDLQKPISDIYRFWNQIRTQLDLHGVRIHDLRHSFASYIVANGNTLYVAQQLLGHSDPRTTMRYAHFAQDMLLEATATLDRILGLRKHLDVNRCAGRIVSKTPERRIRGRGKLKL